MPINVSFNGSTIYKPGSYSKRTIDLGGGFPLGPTGLIAIFGEATGGAPGSAVNISNNVFSPEQLPLIKQVYRSGPIVDACNFLFTPGADGAIPSGAQAVYIYKTNASTKASITLDNTWGTVYAAEYGTSGNRITYKNTLVDATPASVTSSAAFAVKNGEMNSTTLVLRVQGGANYTFTCPTAITPEAISSALALADNWSPGLPEGLTFTVSGTDVATTLKIERVITGNPHRDGFSRGFEIVEGTALSVAKIAAGLYMSTSEDIGSFEIKNIRELITETASVGGDIVLKLARNGGTTPTVTVSSTQIILKNNNAVEHTLDKADFNTINEVVAYINSSTGNNWAAEVGSVLFGQLSPAVLDRVTNLGALSSALTKFPVRIKKDAFDFAEFMGLSSVVSFTPGANAICGLPDELSATYLAGGTLGATSTAAITNALTALQKVRVNAVIPLFSRDATADITDGLTDAASAYTISGVHAAVKTHCSLMATTKARSERQAYLSIKDTFINCKNTAQNLADFRTQLLIQDVKRENSNGAIQWFQPWAEACMLAGARAGSPIGLPMTNKYLNVSGIRHTAQSMNTAEASIVEDFDPDTQYEDAIRNGITFLEHPQSGGFRVVVDNTTYGRDGNWVLNRANVIYAADILEYDFRTQLQNIFVGMKNTISAAEIAATCESILVTYLGRGITVSTPDAKQGFKQLLVQIEGSVVNVSVVVKLVEGIDWVLSSISLQRAVSSAG